MDKKKVAEILDEIGTLLELKGENPFKSRAFHNASRTIESLSGDLVEMIKRDELKDIKGIGVALTEKITTLVTTGRLPYYEDLRKSFPRGLLDLLNIPGLGPKKVKILYEKLKIQSVKELEKACRHDKLLTLEGFGQKTQDNVMKGIVQLHKHAGQFLVHHAWPEAERLLGYLKGHKSFLRVEIAGSLRRCKEVVKDLDFVAGVKFPQVASTHFLACPEISRVIANGETKISVELKSGLQADLRLVEDRQFPYALHHFTGSKEHNTAMRGRAQEKFGIKMNEYGLFRVKGAKETLMPCRSEEEIFRSLKLKPIPPELRENMGEIEAAETGSLPTLIELKDLQGTFHCHSTWSDGRASIREMAEAAQALKLHYLGIADHSQVAAYAGGLTPEAVKRQREEIDRINQSMKGFRLLQGLEVDILKDGRLDMPEKTLASLDYVVISVHSRFGLSREEMTQRLIKAVSHPLASILGHVSGRLLLSREPYEMDVEAVLEAAAKTRTLVEINSNPRRLDLDWRWCRPAKKMGIRFVINPDAHDTEGLRDLRYGVGVARKGWLTAQDVANAHPLETALKWIRAKRE